MTRPLDQAQATEIWRDPARGTAERVADLLARMTLEETTPGPGPATRSSSCT